MPFLSYAQNREDVLLNRIFSGRKEGFYIDVGAYDPVSFSVTKHFYDEGWTGINLEPAPDSYRRVARGRPRDINLNMAVSDREGELTFYQFPVEAAGLCTLSKSEAERRAEQGYRFTTRPVPVTTLASVCRQHVRGPIDFMSIDVEGHELEVISGGDWNHFRPHVLVIEATRPTTTAPAHGSWEHVLLQASYLFATFDGLNRYYVSEEHRDDIEKLQVPANVFDDFVPYEYERRIQELEATIREYRTLTLHLLEPVRALRRSIVKARHQKFSPASALHGEGSPRRGFDALVSFLRRPRDPDRSP